MNRGKAKRMVSSQPLVLTVGHSTRPIEQFLELLQAHEVKRVVDVRTVPRSRTNPQFNKDTLPDSLQQAGIAYSHMPGLGGLRHSKAGSVNAGWRNLSFRGYADYMQTPEFEQSLLELMELARRERVVLMCAEAVPWRCHRSMIADALLVRGWRAEEISSRTRRQAHTITPFAKVQGISLAYPAETAT